MKGFLAGLGSGLLLMVLVLVARGSRPAAPPSPSGSRTDPRELEARLTKERDEKAVLERRVTELQSRAEDFQRQLDEAKAARSTSPDKHSPTPSPSAEPKPGETDPAAKQAKLKAAIQVGKPVTDDVAGHLGLSADQRTALDQALADEGKLLYRALREVAAKDSAQKLPEEDGPAVLIAALGRSMAELVKFNEIFKDPEIAAGRKPVYMDEVFGADSPLVLIAERLDGVRQRMFENVQPSMSPEQFAKYRALYERNFNFGGANYSMPANVHARRR